jgi:hypothetical protein
MRREVFLEEMELVVPWKALLKVIEPFYPVAGRGRRPYPLDSMLRVHLMQNWFALSDPAMEEALYEIASLRNFAGLKLSEPIPDETTILRWKSAGRAGRCAWCDEPFMLRRLRDLAPWVFGTARYRSRCLSR